MRLILVTGACHGQVQEWEDVTPPDVAYGHMTTDSELGELYIKYRLVHWLGTEAYYIPFAWRTGYALKVLLDMKV